MDKRNDLDRIVVGVDGSASSVNALTYAADLAEKLELPLEAVTVWSYPPFADHYLEVEWSPEDDATRVLEDTVREAFGADVPARFTSTVLSGTPAHALIERSASSSMLVLGSRGRGGLAGLLLGSVCSTCASHAHCPVLIVREPADLADRVGGYS